MSYHNVAEYGQFINYEINNQTNPFIQPYIKTLKIKLFSVAGDADLFVSFSNANPTNDDHDYRSRRDNYIDQVTLIEERSSTWLNRPIFFSVFGNSRSQIRIEFEYEFKPTYNEILERSLPIGDGSFIYQDLPDEESVGFYSFTPWWSGRENRTVVFLADMVFNRVFFYASWDELPKHFLTSLHDVNDTIAVYGDNTHYHFNGVYYIKLRPDFGLYDLLSERQYIYNMYAFSMTPAAYEEKERAFETLELGEEYMGFTNQSKYQDYRYF